jgi:hypothetical protein
MSVQQGEAPPLLDADTAKAVQDYIPPSIDTPPAPPPAAQKIDFDAMAKFMADHAHPTASPAPSAYIFSWESPPAEPETPAMPQNPAPPVAAVPIVQGAEINGAIFLPASRPASQNMTLGESFVFTAIGIVLLSLFLSSNRWMPPATIQARKTWRMIMHTIRHRAAFVICLGAAWIAADWLIFNQLNAPDYLDDLHDDHWFSFFGFCAMLVGIYHWIAGPPPN